MTMKIVYFDMDNVLVDFQSGIDQLSEDVLKEYQDRLDEVPRIFSMMRPIDGAIEAFKAISQVYDAYILSTAPWKNPSAWTDKLIWVEKHLGDLAHKRLILTHHKNLNAGDFLIDDRVKNGVDKFSGEHIHFGSDRFPDWASVISYLLEEKTLCRTKEK